MRSLHKKSLVAGIAAIALVALSGCEMDVKLKVIDENTIEPSVIVAMTESEKDMLSSMSDGEEVTCQDLADMEDEDEATVKDLSTGGDMKCEIILPQGQNLNSSENLKKEGDDLVLFLPKEQIYDLKSELNDAGDMSELGMDSITMNLIIQMPHGIKTATVDGQPVDFKGDTVTLDMTDISNEVKIVSSPGIPGGNAGDEADSEYDPDNDLTDAGRSVAAGMGMLILGIAFVGILIIAGIVILIVVLAKKSKAKAIPANQFGQPMNYGQPGQPAQPGQPVQPGQPQFGQPMQPGQPGQPGVGQPVQPGQPQFGQPGQPGQPQPFTQPGQPGQSGQPVQSNPFAQPGTPNQSIQPNQPGQTQFGQPQSFGPNTPDQANPFSGQTNPTQDPNPQN